jgi:hypothetical protein
MFALACCGGVSVRFRLLPNLKGQIHFAKILDQFTSEAKIDREQRRIEVLEKVEAS